MVRSLELNKCDSFFPRIQPGAVHELAQYFILYNPQRKGKLYDQRRLSPAAIRRNHLAPLEPSGFLPKAPVISSTLVSHPWCAFRLAHHSQDRWPPMAVPQSPLYARWDNPPYTKPCSHPPMRMHDTPGSLRMTPHGRL